VLAICVVILLFTVAPLLRDTVATTINPVQHSIAADIHSINKDEAQRIKQAKQYQATFEHDLNQINSDLQSRVGILADVSKQAAKDVTGLRSDLSHLEQSTRQESSSIHGSIDSLSGSLASIKADMATIQRELAYLCAKPSASCPS
jgi:chromosome segregation ATPase